jgi:hypothetical protein
MRAIVQGILILIRNSCSMKELMKDLATTLALVRDMPLRRLVDSRARAAEKMATSSVPLPRGFSAVLDRNHDNDTHIVTEPTCGAFTNDGGLQKEESPPRLVYQKKLCTCSTTSLRHCWVSDIHSLAWLGMD